MSVPKSDQYYIHEKLSLAVRGMVITQGTLQSRLHNAWVHHLSMVEVDKLPEDIQTDFRELHKQSLKNGSFSTINLMSDAEAQDMARRIFDLYEKVVT
jgi:hypothetical protein